jgi:hypothetical protein
MLSAIKYSIPVTSTTSASRVSTQSKQDASKETLKKVLAIAVPTLAVVGGIALVYAYSKYFSASGIQSPESPDSSSGLGGTPIVKPETGASSSGLGGTPTVTPTDAPIVTPIVKPETGASSSGLGGTPTVSSTVNPGSPSHSNIQLGTDRSEFSSDFRNLYMGANMCFAPVVHSSEIEVVGSKENEFFVLPVGSSSYAEQVQQEVHGFGDGVPLGSDNSAVLLGQPNSEFVGKENPVTNIPLGGSGNNQELTPSPAFKYEDASFRIPSAPGIIPLDQSKAKPLLKAKPLSKNEMMDKLSSVLVPVGFILAIPQILVLLNRRNFRFH